jgi:hypothetical protein
MTAPESNRPEDWVQVAEVTQVWQGELIAGRLRASGIEAEIVDQTFHQEPMPNVRAFAVVRVLVCAWSRWKRLSAFWTRRSCSPTTPR